MRPRAGDRTRHCPETCERALIEGQAGYGALAASLASAIAPAGRRERRGRRRGRTLRVFDEKPPELLARGRLVGQGGVGEGCRERPARREAGELERRRDRLPRRARAGGGGPAVRALGGGGGPRHHASRR